MSRNKEHRPNGSAAEGGRPIGGAAEGGASVFFVSAHLFFVCHEDLCIPLYWFHIYIYINKYISQTFSIYFSSCVSYLMESRVALDMTEFRLLILLHFFVSQLTFWSNFHMILHGFACRNKKHIVLYKIVHLQLID